MGVKLGHLTLREEHRLMVFENRVLRRIFRPKREEVVRGWRGLHNEELCNLYTSPNIIRVIKSRRMRWAEHVAHMGKIKNVYYILVGKPEWKTPFRSPKHSYEDNIRMDLRETRWEDVDWMNVTQDRDLWWVPVNMVMNLRVP
jgi:hypothetical protein